ncbi:hypothetical protein CBOM_07941 [Ceraceosorus bombacis]|uniref:Uncharacterized protein n=1 Tax=Ceraceosorus bombacis TaxID=401625 RepID=A0A0P1BR63_9BASI|nr:hypothetical protein CBOM_07941 [Ceraceosorus bombacis]
MLFVLVNARIDIHASDCDLLGRAGRWTDVLRRAANLVCSCSDRAKRLLKAENDANVHQLICQQQRHQPSGLPGPSALRVSKGYQLQQGSQISGS